MVQPAPFISSSYSRRVKVAQLTDRWTQWSDEVEKTGKLHEILNFRELCCASNVIPSGYLEPASVNASPTDSGGTDMFDGPKQWQIKYAFEKIEGIGFKCKICGQIKKHVRNHYLKHFPEHHECYLCRRTYTRKDNLNSHIKRDHLQRLKIPQDQYHRLRRLTSRLEDYQGVRYYTPNLYAQMNISTIHTPSTQPQSPPAPGPMDLSLRPSSVPIQPQCAPMYDILPSLYTYFGN